LIPALILFFVLTPAAEAAMNLSDAFKDNTVGQTAQTAGYNTQANSIEAIVGVVIQAVLSLLGMIFLSLMVYGGYLWMTDRGNEDQVKRARNLISAAVIGLVIVLAAYAISIFVFERLADYTLQEQGVTEEE
jgi:amino acid transporter